MKQLAAEIKSLSFLKYNLHGTTNLDLLLMLSSVEGMSLDNPNAMAFNVWGWKEGGVGPNKFPLAFISPNTSNLLLILNMSYIMIMIAHFTSS